METQRTEQPYVNGESQPTMNLRASDFSQLSSELDNAGYAVFSRMLALADATDIAKELDQAFKSEKAIKVDNDRISITTLNGQSLLDLCGRVKKLYEQTYQAIKKSLPQLVELQDKKIGVSANRIANPAESFGLHFDRNQITVVIYLTSYGSCPLVLYPLVRRDPEHFPEDKDLFINVEELTPVEVIPEPGVAVIFQGRRTLHGAIRKKEQPFHEEKNIASDTNASRLSLQFAFDLSPTDYSDQDYYGA